MIIQEIYLKDWDWVVKVFYAVDTYYVDDILGELEAIGCPQSDLKQAKVCLNGVNGGFAYSNFENRSSVIVIGLTMSAAQFQNTFDHEKGHLAMHICDFLQLNPFGEEFQYLVGEIGQAMFPVAKMFLCDRCRNRQ